MKTIEQILEGVTAGGQWQIDADEPLIIWGPKGPGYGAVAKVSNYTLTGFEGDQVKTAAYAARAARNFPALVEALQRCCAVLGEVDESWVIDTEKDARKVLAEALK